MTKTLATAALAGLLFTLTACGSGNDDQAATAIADSIMKEQGDAQAGSVFQLERSEADCIGQGFVDGIGTEQLQEYGFLDEDLKTADKLTEVEMSTEDAESAADTLLECADVQKMLTAAMGTEVDPETKKCIEGVLTDDALRTLFTKMFSGKQDEASQELIAPLMECSTAGLG